MTVVLIYSLYNNIDIGIDWIGRIIYNTWYYWRGGGIMYKVIIIIIIITAA